MRTSRNIVREVGMMVDLLALLERVASIFVDISDLALPTYQFRPE